MNTHKVALAVFSALLSNSDGVTHNPHETARRAYVYAEAFMSVLDDELNRAITELEE
jgi:hypothetical protein